MKEFNLELAKAGHPVCTRDGCKVRILCYDALTEDGMPPYPIVALVLEGESNEGENVYRYSENGKYYDYENLQSDLMMASVKHEGWVNIYKQDDAQEDLDPFALYQMQQGIFETKDKALEAVKKSINYSTYIATVKIEWEE